MDEIFGDNVYVCDVPTSEILEGLPKEEQKITTEMIQKLRTTSKDKIIDFILNCYENYKTDIKNYTCFTMSLNLCCWDAWREGSSDYQAIFDKYYYYFYDNLDKNFNDKEIQYYYSIMD